MLALRLFTRDLPRVKLVPRATQTSKLFRSLFTETQMAEHYLEFNIPQWVEIQSKDLFVKVYMESFSER